MGIALRSLRTLLELVLLATVIFLATRQPEARLSVGTYWRQDVVYCVPTREKLVALTYDDGPDPRFTPKILDILDNYRIKATFFMIGKQMVANPEIVREVVRRGHVIANHTYTHPRNITLDSPAQMIREMDQCEQLIERMTGKRAHLFRPPLGLLDDAVFTIAGEEGYRIVLWSVCADHHDAPTPKFMAERVLKRIHPGAIILAHDGTLTTRWKDVAATPMIIEGLTKRGYRFVTVPELLKDANR